MVGARPARLTIGIKLLEYMQRLASVTGSEVAIHGSGTLHINKRLAKIYCAALLPAGERQLVEIFLAKNHNSGTAGVVVV